LTGCFASQLGTNNLNFEAANEDAEKVFAEAAAVAEKRMKEKFPEIPSGLPSMESSTESTS
jgi:division protein CdvB (Snf7/Vps24/ESCRT-III family)